MRRRPGVEVVEPTRDPVATRGPFPSAAEAGGFLGLLTLQAHERMS